MTVGKAYVTKTSIKELAIVVNTLIVKSPKDKIIL